MNINVNLTQAFVKREVYFTAYECAAYFVKPMTLEVFLL